MIDNAKPPISAYIRTKNESRMIGDVVRAALNVVDEVVVVDSGSLDDTIAIASKAGARIVQQDWLGNGKQKRVGEEACNHNWLLDLDADEIISPELATEIAALFQDDEPACPVYRTPMAFAPPIGDPWRGFGGQVRHKLYDKRVFQAPDHNVWDQFDIPAGTNIGRLRHPILHHAYADTGHLVDKLNKNSGNRARYLKPKSTPSLLMRIYFGLPFYFLKRYILHGLFRGGVAGFSFSMVAAYGRWLRDVKMYERKRQLKENN